jgi:uncharacterized protein (DUF58 family)
VSTAAAAPGGGEPASPTAESSELKTLRLYSADDKGNVIAWDVGARSGRVTTRQRFNKLHEGAVRALGVAGAVHPSATGVDGEMVRTRV